MAFEWKDRKDIWKGEGIYHLTFVVAGRYALLGQLEAVTPMAGTAPAAPETVTTTETVTQFPTTDEKENRCVPKPIDTEGRIAKVSLSPLGFAISNDLKQFEEHHPGMKLIAKMVMPDHIHIVVWVQKNGLQTIRQVGHGIRMGITHLAKELGTWPVTASTPPAQPISTPVLNQPILTPTPVQSISTPALNQPILTPPPANSSSFVPNSEACHASEAPADQPSGLVLDQPFIRTLSRKGQLKALCQYVHDNAYRRWMKQHNPELFILHQDTLIAGLRFRSMGNHWLLDWPERVMVECSRSISAEDLAQLETQVLAQAEQGAVIYSAAISEGERTIMRKVREAGYPVVILLKDGFPPIGSDKERFYKPGGVYFEACLSGKLLLLEAHEATYEDARIVEATEQQLQRKATERHQGYQPLPHQSLRWRYMAGNEIVRWLADIE